MEAMPHYFLLLNAGWFHERLRPALAASWRQRSFQPCQTLCIELAAAARAFAETYQVTVEGSLPAAVAAGLPFDRNLWRCLVGEALLYGAAETPEIQTAIDTLVHLLAPGGARFLDSRRDELASIQHAYFGSHDLHFGGVCYRPEHVGINDTSDILRLAKYLGSLDPGGWTTADLEGVACLTDEEQREAELDYVRECLRDLCRLYEGARDQGQIIVCEMPCPV